MSADADNACGAAWGERSPERVNSRNGYRGRDFDTRAGSIDLACPGCVGHLLPRLAARASRRAEKALVAVVAEAYVAGVSTRRVDGWSEHGHRRDLQVPGVGDGPQPRRRSRPSAPGPSTPGPTAMWHRRADPEGAEGGRSSTSPAVSPPASTSRATGRSLGFTTERGAGGRRSCGAWWPGAWPGWRWSISDAHEGRSSGHRRGARRRRLAALSNPLHAQPAGQGAEGGPADGGDAGAHHLRAARRANRSPPSTPEWWSSSGQSSPRRRGCSSTPVPTCWPSPAFPKEHWRQIWSNNPQERLNKELRRRTDVVGIFPNRAAGDPPRGRGAGRAERRVGRGPALHERRDADQGPHGSGRRRSGGGEGRAGGDGMRARDLAGLLVQGVDENGSTLLPRPSFPGDRRFRALCVGARMKRQGSYTTLTGAAGPDCRRKEVFAKPLTI